MRRFPHLAASPARVAAPALLALLGWGAASPLAAQAGDGTALSSLAEPGVSRDGSLVAFVSGGDVWTVPSDGGETRLLEAHAAHESSSSLGGGMRFTKALALDHRWSRVVARALDLRLRLSAPPKGPSHRLSLRS